jgi:hypothetical protein
MSASKTRLKLFKAAKNYGVYVWMTNDKS